MWKEVLTNGYESLLFVLFLILFLGFREERRGKYVASVVCGMLLFVNIMVSDADAVFNWYPLLIDAGIMFCYYKLCLCGSFREFVIAFLLFEAGGYLCSNLVIWSFYISHKEGITAWFQVQHQYRIVALILSRCLWTIYLLLVVKYQKHFQFETRMYYFYFSVVAIVGMLLFGMLLPTLEDLYEQAPQIGERMFTVLTCLLVLICIFLVVVMRASRMIRYKVENDALLSLLHSEREAMRQYIEKQNEVYKWAHDLKNRVFAIQYLFSTDFESANKALNEMGHELSERMGTLISAENIWECMIAAKDIEEKEIVLEMQIQAEGIRVDVVDMGILFGNLLDNAVEAVDKISEGEKKIGVNVYLELNMVCITVWNTIEDKGVIDLDLQTKKQDKNRHGYGIQSIRSIVGKYNGSCEFHMEKNKFIAEIQLINELVK